MDKLNPSVGGGKEAMKEIPANTSSPLRWIGRGLCWFDPSDKHDF